MPQIPTFQDQNNYNMPQIPIEPVRRAGAAIQGGIDEITRSLKEAETSIQNEYEAEKRAKDTLDAITLENTMRDKVGKTAEKYANRIDYENFDKDIQKDIQSLKEEIAPKNPDRNLQIAFENAFGHYSGSLQNAVRSRKFTVMSDLGKIEAEKVYNADVLDYATETDPEQKKIIKSNLETKMTEASKNFLLDPIWVKEKLLNFDGIAKQTENNLDDVAADKAIMNNPIQARLDLEEHKNYPSLLPKQRQDKIEKANAAIKIFEHENKRAQEEAEKKAHDDDDRQIGNFFMAGKLNQAYTFAQSSKFLSGDEKRVWANSIKEKSEKKEPIKDNPAVYYNTLLKLKELNLDDPSAQSAMATDIIKSELTDSTKKEMLKEVALGKDGIFNDPWFKFSEQSIKEGLGWTQQMGFFNLQNPQEAENAYRDTVAQLIREVKKDGLKGEDIYKRARQLAGPKIAEAWQSLLTGGKPPKKEEETPESSKIRLFDNPPKAIPKENLVIGKIYKDAQGNKKKYLGDGKWEAAQ